MFSDPQMKQKDQPTSKRELSRTNFRSKSLEKREIFRASLLQISRFDTSHYFPSKFNRFRCGRKQRREDAKTDAGRITDGAYLFCIVLRRSEADKFDLCASKEVGYRRGKNIAESLSNGNGKDNGNGNDRPTT